MRNLIAGVAAQQNACDSRELLAVPAADLIAEQTADNRAHARPDRIDVADIVTDRVLRIIRLLIDICRLISRVACREISRVLGVMVNDLAMGYMVNRWFAFCRSDWCCVFYEARRSMRGDFLEYAAIGSFETCRRSARWCGKSGRLHADSRCSGPHNLSRRCRRSCRRSIAVQGKNACDGGCAEQTDHCHGCCSGDDKRVKAGSSVID